MDIQYRAISVRQPYAGFIAARIKPVENRGCCWSYRGPILIHASMTYYSDIPAHHAELARAMSESGEWGDLFDLRGGIIAIADLVDCVYGYKSEWSAPGMYQHVLERARRVPFHSCRGSLGIFNVWRPDTWLA